MKTIWKWELANKPIQTVEAPEDSIPLSLQVVNGIRSLWMLVDDDKPSKDYIVKSFWTGEMLDIGNEYKYIGTICVNFLVEHYFIA